MREPRDLLPAPGRAHRTWAGSGTRNWTGCPPPRRPRAAGWSGPPWPLRPRRPRLTAAACPAPAAGVGCPPRPARPRRCGSGGGEPPARRAPSSAGPRGGACAEGGCGLGRGRRRRLRPRDVSGGSRAGTAAATANGGAGREGPRGASQWAAGRGGAAAGRAARAGGAEDAAPPEPAGAVPAASREPPPRGAFAHPGPQHPKGARGFPAWRRLSPAPSLDMCQSRWSQTRRGAPSASQAGSGGGFPPRAPQPLRGSQGSGRLVSAGDPPGKRRHPSHLVPFKAPSSMLVLFTGPLGSSCNPEVGRPSAQEEKETRPLGPHLWETLGRRALMQGNWSGARAHQPWNTWAGRRPHSKPNCRHLCFKPFMLFLFWRAFS